MCCGPLLLNSVIPEISIIKSLLNLSLVLLYQLRFQQHNVKAVI